MKHTHKANVCKSLCYIALTTMSLSIVGSNISHYMQFKSSIKTNHIKYDFARAKENITFPNLELCNYQSHSRQLVKEKYPMFNSTTMRLLYTDDFDPKMDISAIDGVNLSQFAIDTAPRISFLACRIGGINCITKWKRVLTPLGVCFRLSMHEDDQFRHMGPLSLNSQSLGLILTTNLSDSTYGWHAARTGLVLYFYHWEEKRNEHQEISLTSSMVQTAELYLTERKLLGSPYTVCSDTGNHQRCDLEVTIKQLESKCNCWYYGFQRMTNETSHLEQCNYRDMLNCGNRIIMAYIYSTKESFHDGDIECTPTCRSWGFDLAERTYRDRSQDLMRYESIMRRRNIISNDETLFSTEITIEIDDLKVISEEVIYPLGELLSDVGGVFGFFLGVNLLQCMTTLWFRIIRSNRRAWVERRIYNPRHYYNGPKASMTGSSENEPKLCYQVNQ